MFATLAFAVMAGGVALAATITCKTGVACIGTRGADLMTGDESGAYNIIYGRGGNDVIRGTSKPDARGGLPGLDVLYGGPGNDRISTGDGENSETDAAVGCGFGSLPCPGVAGGQGNDTITGGANFDALYGDKPNNLVPPVRNESGSDAIDGRGGTDYIDGGAGSDELSGGPGDDTVRDGNRGDPGAGSGLPRDEVVRRKSPDGSADVVRGGDGDDVLEALDGPTTKVKDVIRCGPGDDVAYADRADVVADDCEEVRSR